MDAKLQAFLSKIAAEHRDLKRELVQVQASYNALVSEIQAQPRSITAEIDEIPGRRIFYNLSGDGTFTADQAGQRGQPINFLISQDGPYVMTHYPLVIWKPTAPDLTTNFGRWRPVASWPLPDQVLDEDIIDLSYEFVDGGSQRNFQNAVAGPLFSRPDNLVPLPVPTLFAPNSTIQFFPTFEAILFDSAVPPTEGELRVTLPGYRIVNL